MHARLCVRRACRSLGILGVREMRTCPHWMRGCLWPVAQAPSREARAPSRKARAPSRKARAPLRDAVAPLASKVHASTKRERSLPGSDHAATRGPAASPSVMRACRTGACARRGATPAWPPWSSPFADAGLRLRHSERRLCLLEWGFVFGSSSTTELDSAGVHQAQLAPLFIGLQL